MEKEIKAMFTFNFKSLSTAWVLLAVTLLVTAAGFGQSTTQTPIVGQVGYYTNANTGTPGFPDAQMHVMNPGNLGGYGSGTTSNPSGGDLCANIYVFTSDQQMAECCSCLVSPNGMEGFSLATNLVNNPVTGVPPKAGMIMVVPSIGDGSWAPLPPPGGGQASAKTCNAAYTYKATTGILDVWITHVRALGGSFGPAYDVSEVSFAPTTLDQTELTYLQEFCASITLPPSSGGLGSGQGTCSCGTSF